MFGNKLTRKLHGWQRILALILAFAIAIISSAIFSPHLSAQIPPKNPRKTELRGVWLTNIDSDVFFSRKNVTDAVNRLDELNFNTIYPTVGKVAIPCIPAL